MPAGYSGTPLIKKLGIKLTNFVHAFVTQREELAKLLKKCRDALPDDGMVWISWPKRASKVATTITEDGDADQDFCFFVVSLFRE